MTKHKFGLRMSLENKRRLTINYGEHIAKTGSFINLSEYVILKISERLNLVPTMTIRKSKPFQFQVKMTSDMHQLSEKASHQEDVSVNKFLIKQILS